MKKLLLALSVTALIANTSQAQNRHWLLKNTMVTMTSHPTYATSTVSTSAPMDPFSDAVFDENDNLLFYVSGRNVYSSSGSVAATLPSFWEPPTINDCLESMDAFQRRGILNKDLLIVPVPKACKKYYLIYSLMPTAMGSNSLVYVTIDVSSGTPVMGATNSLFYPGCGWQVNASLIYTFCCNVNTVQAVASKVYNTGTGNRYLFATGRGTVQRFNITASGIGSATTIANTSSSGGIFTNNDDFMAGDMELSPDQTKLAWSPNFSNSNKTVYMINLSGYSFSSAKKFTNTLSVGGIEFNNASSAIYITNSNGIQSVATSAASGTGFTTAFAGSQYASSNLEMGLSGLMYVVNGTTQNLEYKDLVTPTSSGSTSITVTSSTSYGVTEFNLPNQIKNQNYQYFTGADTSYDNLISKDDNLDIGAQENLQSTNIWESPDIFNCRTGMGTCTSHQNPGYLSPGTGNNYMRVRVKNIGCFNSHPAQVKMYWTLGSTGETWPNAWNGNDEICSIDAGGELINPATSLPGIDVPVLASGQEVVVTLPWDPIDPTIFTCQGLSTYSDGKPMICLLGRIVSAYDPMYSEIPGPISHNVKFNNNIVTRNTSLVPLAGSKPGPIHGGSTSVLVHNYLASEAHVNIRFGSVDPGNGFGQIGAVELTLSDQLWEQWAVAGFSGSGVEISNPQAHQIRIFNLDHAELNNISLPPNGYGGLTFLFSILDSTEVEGEYRFSVTQTMAGQEGQLEEGSQCHFLVTVKATDEEGGDDGSGAGGSDGSGLAGLGQPINKMVNLGINDHVDLFPNPNTGVSQLKFYMAEEGKVSIQVLDLNGKVMKTIADMQTMSGGVHEVNVSSEGLANGVYMLQLVTPDMHTTKKMSVVK